jgi:hypothetical protein
MIKADECFWSYWLKEVIVPEDFEVGNGVLELNRDAYLSLVKFLGSSTIRRV